MSKRYIGFTSCVLFSFLGSSAAFSGSVDPDVAVKTHNKWRNLLNQGELGSQPVPAPFLSDMYWDESLAASAQTHTDQCVWEHSSGSNSENLYTHSGSFGSMETGIDMWANEHTSYDYHLNSSIDGESIGHYTQVVWDSSLRVGCAKTQCSPVMNSDGTPLWTGDFYACQYQSPGNWFGVKPYSTSENLNTVVNFIVNNENLDLPLVNISGDIFRIKMTFKTYDPPVFEMLAFAVVGDININEYPDMPYFDGTSIIVPKLTLDGAGDYYVKFKYIEGLDFEMVEAREN